MNAHDLIKEAIAEKGKFDSVYWIACGGSMIDLIPAHELLQREATTFTSYIYTAREFDIMRPRRLGEKSLVIACSHSGNTPEVVEGCEIALAAGATVIAQTDNAGSKIDSGKWTTWVYPWGEGVPQAEVPAGISLSLAAELLDQQEGYADLADMYAGIAEMDKILPPAREKVNAELGDRFAKLDTWSMYLITSYEDAQNAIGKKADKNRKIYNGMIKTYYYQYIGPKPPRREQRTSEI